MRLHLGCGRKRLVGWVNVDSSPVSSADVVHDLDVFPYPWEDNSVSEIRMHHVLEHLSDPVRVLTECHRVLRPGGVLDIRVPHWNADLWGNLWHKHRFSCKCFKAFDTSTKEYCGTVGGLWPVPDYKVCVKPVWWIMRFPPIIVEIQVSMVKK